MLKKSTSFDKISDAKAAAGVSIIIPISISRAKGIP